jgi:adenylosuccinate lyase
LLFQGDQKKVKQLDRLVAQKMGFTRLLPISAQTYPRKFDIQVLDTLSSLAASCHKLANDIRLLSHLKEIEEPFEEGQVGSSAMPHKRNPILSERVCALARFLLSLSENPRYTAALQWLERSLDDSANRRLVLPEAFLTADSLLNLLTAIVNDLKVFPAIIEKNLKEELPFLATEVVLMEIVRKGGDRQKAHAKLKELSFKASSQVKEGKPHQLLKTIALEFGFKEEEVNKLLQPEQLTGMAGAQVIEFLQDIEETYGRTI